MRESPPLPDGRSASDYLILGGVGLAVLGFIGWLVAQALIAAATPIDTLDGPALFRTQGCAACHLRESVTRARGPGLKDYPITAKKRAAQRSAAESSPYSAADYTIESLVRPQDYVVDSYPAIMNPTQLPPKALARLAAHLLERPEDDPEIARAIGRFGIGAPLPDPASLPGDLERGRALFHTPRGQTACTLCHNVNPEDKSPKVGPSLHDVGVNPPVFLRESILEPNKVILQSHVAFIVYDGDRSRDGRIELRSPPSKDKPGVLALITRSEVVELEFKRLYVGEDVPLRGPGIEVKPLAEGRLSDEVIELIEDDDDALSLGVMRSKISLMPSSKGILEEGQIDDLVKYLSSLRPPGLKTEPGKK